MIAENIVHFARVLRNAGLAIGPDRVLAATGGASKPSAWTAATTCTPRCRAVMIDRHEQQVLFDAAFDAFWRDPKLLEQLMYLLLPKISGRGDKARPPRANRLAEALAAPRPPAPPNPANETAKEEIQFDTTFTFSERERLAAGRLRDHDHGRVRTGEEARRADAAAGAAGAPAPPRGRHDRSATAAGSTCARRCSAWRASRTPCSRRTRTRAPRCRRSSCCSTSRARWTATRACSCTTCTA